MGPYEAANRDGWRQVAACRGAAARAFYPETEAGVRRAKAICARCPVTQFCLELALRNRERHGIWGGMTDRERARYRRRNLRVA